MKEEIITEEYRREKFKLEDEIEGTWAIKLEEPPKRLTSFLQSKKIVSPHLDVGCHVGHFILPLARKGIEVYGLDASQKVLGFAKKYAAQLGIEINLHHGLAQEMPYNDNFFGSVSCFQMLEHSESDEHLALIMGQLWRVLKPGGWLMITVPYKDKIPHISHIFHWYSAKEIIDNLVMECKELHISKTDQLYKVKQRK